MKRVDVVVIGAGSAGAAAAWQCARRGLQVQVLDRRPLGEAGARWSNAVPGWTFDASDTPRPQPPEGGPAPTMWLTAGWGPQRVELTGQDVIEVDMRRLIARLQTMAADAGAELEGGRRVRGVEGDTVHTDRGAVRADWIVDASGLHGLPDAWRVDRTDMCTAVQEVRTVRDRAAAHRFFEARGVPVGDILCFSGVAGGYAIVNVRVHGDEVAILTGSIPGAGYTSGRVLMDRFVAEQPWVGEMTSGGGRAIPLVPPPRTLHDGRVVRIGDAAGQVFSAHGSGVGVQLVAAQLLGEVAAAGGRPADYSRRWWREHGGEIAASAVFQRWSRHIDDRLLARLIAAGLMEPSIARATLEQRAPDFTLGALGGIARGILRDPGAAARILPTVARMQLTRLVAPNRAGGA